MSGDDLSENYRWAQQFLRGILGRPPFPPDIEVLAKKIGEGEAERTYRDRRDVRQGKIASWIAAAFGQAQASSLRQRAIRLLEETVEACQAADVDPAMGHRLIDYIYSRPVGELGQELGGIAVTVLGLAAAAGLSAEDEERREVERVLNKPIAFFATRNEEKNAAGFNAIDTSMKP